jgi:uncharacterized protein YigE (DUF2233 family)
MRRHIILLLFVCGTLQACSQDFDSYVAKADKTAFYYRLNGKGIGTLPALAALHPEIRFAMNMQMYAQGNGASYPVGLYIENGKKLSRLVRVNNPKVNFGMQPQGVFAITQQNKAVLVALDAVNEQDYKYAVEVAPLVVINSAINPRLTKSASRCIRNGVGILKDGRILFAISKEPVTFQEFANYFLKNGCTTAAYIDGVVSQSWHRGEKLPYAEEFAVMVGAQ